MGNTKLEKTQKALRFVKFFFPVAKIILLTTLTIGLVMRMAGVECLTSSSPDNTMVSEVTIDADANPKPTTASPAYYDEPTNDGTKEIPGKFHPEVKGKNSEQYTDTLGNLNYKHYGKWINSNIGIKGGEKFEIVTSGSVNLCAAKPIIKTIQVNASGGSGSTGIYVNYGDTVDFNIISGPSAVAGANGNKWAPEGAHSIDPRGGVADPDHPHNWDMRYTAVLPASYSSAAICSASNIYKPKIDTWEEYCNGDDSTGECSDPGGYHYRWAARGDAPNSCWFTNGTGLLAQIGSTTVVPVRATIPPAATDTEIMVGVIHPENHLNLLMSPYTRVNNTTPDVTQKDNDSLTDAQKVDNYRGYYIHSSTMQGNLTMSIDVNSQLASAASGGYMVKVTVIPKPCTATDGIPYKKPPGSTYDGGDTDGMLEAKIMAPGLDPNDRNDAGNPITSPPAALMDIIVKDISKADTTIPDPTRPAERYNSQGYGSFTSPTAGYALSSTAADGTTVDGGVLWFKIKDSKHSPFNGPNDDLNKTYEENSGEYLVSVSKYYRKDPISSIIMSVLNPIQEMINGKDFNGNVTSAGVVEISFKNMVGQAAFIKAIRALVTLYIIFYFLMFLMGTVQISQKDFVIRMVKVSIVLALIAPGSWNFFNDNLFMLFTAGGRTLMSNMTGGIGDAAHPFAFVDKSLGVITQRATVTRILALFMVYPIGWFFVVIIILGMWNYALTIVAAVRSYLMSLILVGMLLTMAPIFLSFMLFGMTKSLFDTWAKMLFRYTLEPIMLLVGLTIINEIVVIALHGVIGNPACWKCAIEFNIPGYGGDLFCFYFYMPWGYNANVSMLGLDVGAKLFVSVAMFEIVTALAHEFVHLMPRVTAPLTGTSAISGVNLTGGAGGFDSPGQSMSEDYDYRSKQVVGRDKTSIKRREAAGKGTDADHVADTSKPDKPAHGELFEHE